MPDDPIKIAEEERRRERERLLRLVGSIYAEGYSSGASQTAYAYQLPDTLPAVGLAMPEKLEIRLDLVDDAVASYRKMVGAKAAKLREAGVVDEQRIEAELTAYARTLADSRGEIIAEMEHAQAKLDGAGRVLDEAGVTYEWRFPHFDLGPAHIECAICMAIREKAPYTQAQAEANGFPSHPHPNCDHGWVIVPVGEETLTEQFPPQDWWERSGGSGSQVPPIHHGKR